MLTAHFTGTSGTPDSTTSYFMGGQYEVKDGATKKYYSIAGMMVAMNDGSGLQYLLTDHLGSTVAVTNSSGTLTSQQRYLPFGAPRTIPNSPILGTDFTYTGQRKLDDGMGGIMDYKARFYSPALGRFIQPDSIVPNPSNPQAFNRFSYVYNRPIIFTDPTGHDAYWCQNASCQASYDKSKKEGFFAAYGVELEGAFTSKEKLAIMVAIAKVGNRFAETRGTGETAADAFVAAYEYINIKKESGAGYCGDLTKPVDSGGCTDDRHNIRFWSMSGHNDNGVGDISRMMKNVIHELGHAFNNSLGYPDPNDPSKTRNPDNDMSSAFTRNLLYPNQTGDNGGQRWEWQQSPEITTSEVFADMFLAWTLEVWNPDPQYATRISDANLWMTGLVSKP